MSADLSPSFHFSVEAAEAKNIRALAFDCSRFHIMLATVLSG